MKAAALSTAIIAALALKAQATDPNVNMTGFTKVQSNAGIEVTVVEGQDFRIEAYAKRGSLSRLRIDQHGDTLVIDRRGAGLSGTLWNSGRNHQFEVLVALPELHGVEALSGSSLSATVDDADEFYAHVAQGASLTVTGLKAKTVDAKARTGASLSLAGTCSELALEARMGAAVSAKDLACSTVDVASSSGSSVIAHALASVEGEARSGGSLLVAGSPATYELVAASGGTALLN